jgi:hypothetical protein
MKKLFILAALVAGFILAFILALPFSNSPRGFGGGHPGNPETYGWDYVGDVSGPSSGTWPGKGNCLWFNNLPEGVPYVGWPIGGSGEWQCHEDSVTSPFCDPTRFPWTHSGLDLGYPGVGGDANLVTIRERPETEWEEEVVVDQVRQTGWNYGMGTNVRVCEYKCWLELEWGVVCQDGANGGELDGVIGEDECYFGQTVVKKCKQTKWCASYYHLIENSIVVEEGEYLVRGDYLGPIDTTGNSSGHHLHYQLTKSKEPGYGDGTEAYDPAPTMCGGGLWYAP